MKHLFVPYNVALLAKEKGFDEYCFAYFYAEKEKLIFETKTINNTTIDKLVGDGGTAAPLYQQLIDWFREKHRIIVGVQITGNSIKQYYLPFIVKNLNPNLTTYFENKNEDYPSALIKAFEEAFKLI